MNSTLYYIKKKILWTIPILIGITFLAFSLGLMGKGDPATTRASADPNYIPTEEEIEEIREEMGLNDSIFVQYIHWMEDVLHGDFGTSYIDDKPVFEEMMRLMPNTLILSVMSLSLIIVLGLIGGIFLVWFQDRFLDLTGRIALVFFMSIPGFCLAYFMIWLFAQKLHILPTSGVETMVGFVMPCLAVSIGSSCVAARMLRISILGELSQNYILTIQAKGFRRSQCIFRHALRNSLIPFITYIANVFGGLLGGSMITESVFSVPGIGSYALNAINNRDYVAIQGYVLFTGVVFALTSLFSDLICAWLNPQIRLGE